MKPVKYYLVSVHKWPFSAISASIGGIACAAYRSMPPRNSLISLNLRKIAHFWIGNLSVLFMKPRMDTIYRSMAKKTCGLLTRGAGSSIGAGKVTVTAVALRSAVCRPLFQIEDHCLVGGFFQDGILNAEQPGSSPLDKDPQKPDDCQTGV
jgi:hypothetical protein